MNCDALPGRLFVAMSMRLLSNRQTTEHKCLDMRLIAHCVWQSKEAIDISIRRLEQLIQPSTMD